MREILTRFYKDYDLRFEVMFKENIIFMRFFTPSMFEPKVFGNSMDKKLLFTYYNIIKFISEVTNQIEKESRSSQEIHDKPKEKEVVKEEKIEPKNVVPFDKKTEKIELPKEEIPPEPKEEIKAAEEEMTTTLKVGDVDIIKEKKTKSKKMI